MGSPLPKVKVLEQRERKTDPFLFCFIKSPSLPSCEVGFPIISVSLGTHGYIDLLDKHVFQVFAIEGIKDAVVENYVGLGHSLGLRHVDIRRRGQISIHGRVHHGSPLKIGLKTLIVPGDDQFLSLEGYKC